jgi:spoIIIJ-associated protein
MEDKQPITAQEISKVEKIIEKLFSFLEIEGTFEIEHNHEMLDIIMETKDTGIIIGYHGEGLESIQLILSLMISKKLGRFIRISIEVDGYKKNRTEYLHKLAQQIKEKVLSENKPQTLHSLKPWERRIVHMFFQDDQEVISESTGEGKERALIIKPKA